MITKSAGLGWMSMVLAIALFGCGPAEHDAGHAGSGHSHESDTADEREADDGAVLAPLSASANIGPKNDSGVSGTATFRAYKGKVSLHIEIQNATPGEHAFHLHEIGDCSSADGKSAGGHWNPTGADHGRWGHEPYHLGDVGNIVVDDSGNGSYVLESDVWSLGTGDASDVIGKAVIAPTLIFFPQNAVVRQRGVRDAPYHTCVELHPTWAGLV